LALVKIGNSVFQIHVCNSRLKLLLTYLSLPAVPLVTHAKSTSQVVQRNHRDIFFISQKHSKSKIANNPQLFLKMARVSIFDFVALHN
jgi:hypothetical protein